MYFCPYKYKRDTTVTMGDGTAYTGQALLVEDSVVIGDISSTAKSIAFTIKPLSTSTNIIQLASGVNISIASETINTSGLTNVNIFVNNVETTTCANDVLSRVVINFDEVSCSDVVINFNSIISDLQLWSEHFNYSDVKYDYNYPEKDISNRSGTFLVNPVGWWKLSEGSGTVATDSSGNSNDATISGLSTGWIDGRSVAGDPRISQKLIENGSFDGFGYVTIPSSNPSSDLIIEAVIDITGTSSSVQSICTGKNFDLYFPANSDTLTFSISGTTVTATSCTGSKIHIVCYYKSDGTIEIYKQGVLVDSGTGASLTTNSTDLTIGENVVGSITSFNCWFDNNVKSIVSTGLSSWAAKRYNFIGG